MMNTVQIGLAAWIIQDGNYGDFSVGQEAQFALDFYFPDSFAIAQPGTPKFVAAGPATYSIHARVEFAHEKVWTLDFGLRAYQEHPPQDIPLGSWVQGNIYLGIDSFPYFERLKDLPGMPALTYRWLLRNIKRETTPWIKVDGLQERDSSRRSFEDIRETNAWHDDGGHAHYILECECLGPS
jgi:hypothetical protein